jgi:purine-binding chemotaxis protein CheW
MSVQLVVFQLRGDEYAFPIAGVSEIIRHATPRAVDSDTPGVRGVIGLRGKIIPVIDLVARLSLGFGDHEGAADAGKVIVIDTDGRQLGVMVDDVDQVVTISDDQLEEVPSAGSLTNTFAKLDERLVMVLDPAELAGQTPSIA